MMTRAMRRHWTTLLPSRRPARHLSRYTRRCASKSGCSSSSLSTAADWFEICVLVLDSSWISCQKRSRPNHLFFSLVALTALMVKFLTKLSTKSVYSV